MYILQYGAVHIEQELLGEQEQASADDNRDAMDWQRWFMKRSDVDAGSNALKLVRTQVQAIPQEQLPRYFGRRDTEGVLEFLTQQPRQAYAKWLQLFSRVNPKLTRRMRSTPQLVPLVFFFFMARVMGEIDAKKMFRRYFQGDASSVGAATSEAAPSRKAWLTDALAHAGRDDGRRVAPGMHRAEELRRELRQLQATASPFPEVRARRVEEVRGLLRVLEDAGVAAPDLAMLDLSEIAARIRKAWKNVHPAARPYLSAMSMLSKITDDYGSDPGSHIVNYFLSNASSFRGPEAKAIKAELKKRVKGGR